MNLIIVCTHIIYIYILFVWYIFVLVLERFNDWSGSEPSQSSTRGTGSETLKRCFNFDQPPLRTPPSWKVLSEGNIHPQKPTWNPKMRVWKMIFLFKGVIFRFHVGFGPWGCTFNIIQIIHPMKITSQMFECMQLQQLQRDNESIVFGPKSILWGTWCWKFRERWKTINQIQIS